MRKDKNINVVMRNICIICILAVLPIIVFTFLNVHYKKNKAKDVAIKYLEDTYMEQMICTGVRLSVIDCMYKVYFTTKSNSNLKFEILVMTDFTLKQHPNEYNPNNQFVPDNYLLEKFDFYFSNEVQKMVDNVWDERTSIT